MPASFIHTSPYGGTWYPKEPAELAGLMEKLWRESAARTGPHLLAGGLAFVVPHAGLVYSGTVAAAVYRYLERQRPECILLAGFAHSGAAAGIGIPDIDGFRTPLGEVAIDRDLADRLAAEEPFRGMPESELCDHSVEIQLPLLQKAAPEARVVPLYVGHLQPLRPAEGCPEIGKLPVSRNRLTRQLGSDPLRQCLPLPALSGRLGSRRSVAAPGL